MFKSVFMCQTSVTFKRGETLTVVSMISYFHTVFRLCATRSLAEASMPTGRTVVKSHCVLVSGLDPATFGQPSTHEALENHFSRFGRILTIHPAIERHTRRIMVEFASRVSATLATIKQKHSFHGRSLVVKRCESAPKKLTCKCTFARTCSHRPLTKQSIFLCISKWSSNLLQFGKIEGTFAVEIGQRKTLEVLLPPPQAPSP